MISKLPNAQTSIFAVMTKMANECGAINLAQGFPDFDVAPELIDRIHYYMQKGMNQYAPMPGVLALREAIAKKIDHTFGVSIESDEVTVTAGATQALFATITAIVHAGDEVIFFDPAYDCYLPTIQLCGGVPININLDKDDFSIPWKKVEQKITAKTKLIIINTPHNPSGAVLTENDMNELARLTRDKEIYVISDEVYEHLIYDGQAHHSVLKNEELRKKSVAIYSFGKTFHATGWKMGYTVAPPFLTDEIRKVHQFLVFSVSTATQWALADYLNEPKHYEYLPSFFQQKRDYLLDLMAPSRFKPITCKGTYFQSFSYAAISDQPDRKMAEWITKTHGVASIPLSPFYTDHSDHQQLRLCFAKSEETLKQAAQKLCQI
ncbi:2-keto-4-methylthiobutyrate aminotransferase apoenzyme [Reichenbachiella faecimaris]|uniref:2-keto-4-methylthiobutyrate aminotransferase apoenzyme n=1 Tax=Reichenbachiella faecimaris TaxID=692418 RepID=A0A1W2GER0_REIFA|nr:methionine aminotransferase [Reichenbachiella faecimaris]SMD35004.1 2-keto-4-methylthiobutyrate aminotransferase apoenzyme [Reichenbachiella faecimaris]